MSFNAVLDRLHLAPGHRVRMVQFFHNEARKASRAMHEAMLAHANSEARFESRAAREREAEMAQMRQRLRELEGEASAARQNEAAASAAAREAWAANQKASRLASKIFSGSTRLAGGGVLYSHFERLMRPVFDAWHGECAGKKRQGRFLRRLMNREVARAFSQWVDIWDSLHRLQNMMKRWMSRSVAKV